MTSLFVMSRGRKPKEENFDFDSFEKNYFNEDVPIKKKKEQKMKLRKATWKRILRMQNDILSIMDNCKSMTEVMRSIEMNFHCLKTTNPFAFSGPVKFTTTLEPYKFEIPVDAIKNEVPKEETKTEKDSKNEKEKESKSDHDEPSDSDNPFVVS